MNEIFKYKTGDEKKAMIDFIEKNFSDTYDTLNGVEVICRNQETYNIIDEIIGQKYRLYHSLGLEEDISFFLTKKINAIIITPDIEFQDAGALANTFRGINPDILIIRIINKGDSIAGSYTKLMYTPINPLELTYTVDLYSMTKNKNE